MDVPIKQNKYLWSNFTETEEMVLFPFVEIGNHEDSENFSVRRELASSIFIEFCADYKVSHKA